jgi:hypothetical protein
VNDPFTFHASRFTIRGGEIMFANKKIAFIGPGVMAEAMIGGLIRQQVAKPEAILAAGPGQERLMEPAGSMRSR